MAVGGRARANFGVSDFKYKLIIAEDISAVEDLGAVAKVSLDDFRRKKGAGGVIMP